MTNLEGLKMQLQYAMEKYGEDALSDSGTRAADRRDRAIETLGPKSAASAVRGRLSQGEKEITDDVTEPLPDSLTGRTSFVRAMAAQIANTEPFESFEQWEWNGCAEI